MTPNNTPLDELLGQKLTRALFSNRISTLSELASQIERRGRHWWMPVPGMTAGRALIVEHWVSRMVGEPIRHYATPDPFLDGEDASDSPLLDICAGGQLAPLERIRLSPALDGSRGQNRCPHRATIRARNDMEAIRSYLTRCRDEPKTVRSYQKELERFLLWCVTERGIALSSVMQDDCEAYKDFLDALHAPLAGVTDHINDRWVGPRAARHSEKWKPFAGPLAASSKAYAFVTLKTFFKWLVDVQYLSANPWFTVAKPRTVARTQKGPDIKIEKAFPSALWNKLSEPEGVFDALCSMTQADIVQRYKLRGQAARLDLSAQFRLARAVILFSANSGLRREELASAIRSDLSRVPDETNIWQLNIIGKGFKKRTVYVDSRTVKALEAHWQDRSSDFADASSPAPLFSPVNLTVTAKTRIKHMTKDGEIKNAGFSPDGIYKLVTAFYRRIADDMAFKLTMDERDFLNESCVHALRHTFGTRAASKDMPLDVLQGLMGHASLQTTTIYTQSEKKRAIKESKRFFRN